MRIMAFLACLLATALLAGCGASTAPEASESATITNLSQLAGVAAEANSSRFELTLELSAKGMPDGFSIGASGAFDTAAKKAQIDLDLSSLGRMLGDLLAGFGGQQTGGIDFADPDGWKMSIVSEDDKAYLRFPLLDSQLGGKKWVLLDAKALSSGAANGFDPKLLEQFSDPTQILDLLGKISGQLENLGQEDVRGESTTHYRAVIDVAKVATLLQDALGAQAGATPLDFSKLVEQLKGESGLSEIPLELWLGSDSLPRRIAVELQMGGQGDEGSLSLAMDMFDWGQPIDVDVPDASETVDSSALEKLGGLLGGTT